MDGCGHCKILEDEYRDRIIIQIRTIQALELKLCHQTSIHAPLHVEYAALWEAREKELLFFYEEKIRWWRENNILMKQALVAALRRLGEI